MIKLNYIQKTHLKSNISFSVIKPFSISFQNITKENIFCVVHHLISINNSTLLEMSLADLALSPKSKR